MPDNNPYRYTAAQIEYYANKWRVSHALALVKLNEMTRKALDGFKID